MLLAEDNAVNQQVAVHLPQKTRAQRDRPLQTAMRRWLYSKNLDSTCILMDLQIPHVNGLQVTATIRKAEESTGEHLPIIAMTAHAMEGDRERCLAAGMDGYVAKPIQCRWTDPATSKTSAGRRMPRRRARLRTFGCRNPSIWDWLCREWAGDIDLLQEAGAL